MQLGRSLDELDRYSSNREEKESSSGINLIINMNMKCKIQIFTSQIEVKEGSIIEMISGSLLKQISFR